MKNEGKRDLSALDFKIGRMGENRDKNVPQRHQSLSEGFTLDSVYRQVIRDKRLNYLQTA